MPSERPEPGRVYQVGWPEHPGHHVRVLEFQQESSDPRNNGVWKSACQWSQCEGSVMYTYGIDLHDLGGES